MRQIRSLWLLVPILLLTLAAACSGSNNNSKAASNNAPASGGASNSQQTNSGGSSGDCAYASKVYAALLPLTNINFDSLTAATPSSAADANALVGKVVDGILGPLNTSLTSLKNTNPPSDFKQFHSDFVGSVQQAVDQLNSAKTAASSGDLAKAASVLSQTGDTFGSSFDNLEKKYPQLTARLDKCPTPKP